jgi:hypothetical protein
MSYSPGIIEPPKTIIQTLVINNYMYSVYDLTPHTSIKYSIDCFYDAILVKTITGILEGEQYKEWTTDEWLDAFIKSKIEAL